jgi:hypothetical protein
MLIATLIHLDRFNHGDAPFLGAFAFCGWTPCTSFLRWSCSSCAGVTARPTRASPPPVSHFCLPPSCSPRAFAVVALVAGAIFFLSPTTAIDIWPWELTPLTARVLASFTAQVGVGALVLSFDRRRGTWRLIVQTFLWRPRSCSSARRARGTTSTRTTS